MQEELPLGIPPLSRGQKIKKAVEGRLIDEWPIAVRKLWSIRVQLIAAAVSGLYSAWPAFQDLVAPWKFALVFVLLSITTVVLRLLKQPGVPDGGGDA